MDRNRLIALLLSVSLLSCQTAFASESVSDPADSAVVFDTALNASAQKKQEKETTDSLAPTLDDERPIMNEMTNEEFAANPILEQVEITEPVSVNNDCTVIISETSLLDFMIPSEICGYAVTNLTENAFRGMSYFKTVTIPKSIGKIGSNAFADCDGLEYIILLGRADTEDLELGENWAGNAEVVFEKVLVEKTAGDGSGVTDGNPVILPPSGTDTDANGQVSSNDTVYRVEDDAVIIPMPGGPEVETEAQDPSNDLIYDIEDDVVIIPMPGGPEVETEAQDPSNDLIYDIEDDAVIIPMPDGLDIETKVQDSSYDLLYDVEDDAIIIAIPNDSKIETIV